MSAFILKAGRYVRAGGIVVQALGLVVAITEQIASKRNVVKQPNQTNDPKDGE